jgi:hypothetical protein
MGGVDFMAEYRILQVLFFNFVVKCGVLVPCKNINCYLQASGNKMLNI